MCPLFPTPFKTLSNRYFQSNNNIKYFVIDIQISSQRTTAMKGKDAPTMKGKGQNPLSSFYQKVKPPTRKVRGGPRKKQNPNAGRKSAATNKYEVLAAKLKRTRIVKVLRLPTLCLQLPALSAAGALRAVSAWLQLGGGKSAAIMRSCDHVVMRSCDHVIM